MHRHDMIILFDDGCVEGWRPFSLDTRFLAWWMIADDRLMSVRYLPTRYESENRDNTSYVGILGI